MSATFTTVKNHDQLPEITVTQMASLNCCAIGDNNIGHVICNREIWA